MPDHDLTIGELLRMWRMYNIRESKKWERVRFIAWYGSLPYQSKESRMELYDIIGLPTDPTEEEKKEMIEEKNRADAEHYKKVFDYYREQGFNV